MNNTAYKQGVVDTIQRVTNHLEARLHALDEPTNRNIGALGLANDLMDLLQGMINELKPCEYCLDNPCRCEAIDAQRDYGRPETWAGNDY
jgi:hypothetical protein